MNRSHIAALVDARVRHVPIAARFHQLCRQERHNDPAIVTGCRSYASVLRSYADVLETIADQLDTVAVTA